MALRTCFLDSFGGIPCAHGKSQSSLRCPTQVRRQYIAKRKRTVIRCIQEQEHLGEPPTDLDGELKEVFSASMQDNPSDANTLQESDRRVMDGITETGVKEIEDIVNAVKEDLEDLQSTVEQNARKLIDEETQAVLEQYDQKREELLSSVKKDREIISKEMEQIKKLAENIEGNRGIGQTTSLQEKASFLMCSIFTISALYYAWKGVTDADSAALTNSAIDAAFAATATFAFSREKPKE